MRLAKDFWGWIDGKKTFIIGIAGIIWGLYTKDDEVIFASLALMGLRDAIRKLE